LDYENTIRDDPIELLNKIKILMHDLIRAKYPFASLTETMIRMLNIKQGENEGLLDYVKQFKQTRDVTESHVETDILDKFIENTREYQEEADEAAKKELKNGTFAKWMAYLLLRNSDQSKYGSVLDGLISQYSMGNNRYPKMVRSTTDVLSNHKFDRRRNQRIQGNQKGKRNWNDSKKDGEDASQPPTVIASKTSFAQGGKAQTCYCCGKTGHISPECPDKNTIKKEDWYIRKAELHMQAVKEGEHKENESMNDNASQPSVHTSRVGWSRLLVPITTTEEESHYNNDHNMGSRLKN
jgi:hypothetical protein